jgi:hypothetical protein
MPLLSLLAALPMPEPPAEPLAAVSSGSVLVLERTSKRLPRTGDPIWDLRLQIPGQPERHFAAVSGRADRQTANRHRMGSEAPLPAGSYWIGAAEPLGRHGPQELGPIWIGIEPQFETGRRVLGIHLDPSAGRNWNSGTSGCVGLIHERDMRTLAELLRRNGTSTLVVAN